MGKKQMGPLREREVDVKSSAQESYPSKDNAQQLWSRELSRRDFILCGTAAVSGLLSSYRTYGTSRGDLITSVSEFQQILTISVLRTCDLLNLDFSFMNLELDPDAEITQLRRIRAAPAFLIVNFPPQHLSEQAFKRTPSTRSLSRIAGKSRLVFKVPDGVSSIPFSIEGLLAACKGGRYELNVAPTAQPLNPPFLPNPLPTISQPAVQHTAIEAPYGLFLSPSNLASWDHIVESPAEDCVGRTELWHTRMMATSRDGVRGENQNILRAIWSEGYDPKAVELPQEDGKEFANPSGRQRYEIVRLTSDFYAREANGEPYVPAPLEAKQLILSALGAWLDVSGVWSPPKVKMADGMFKSLIVESWQHQMAEGRDQKIRIVSKGYLYPFGFQASYVEIQERVIEEGVAYLRMRSQLIVPKDTKDYSGRDDEMPYGGRQMSLKKITINPPTIQKDIELEAIDKGFPRTASNSDAPTDRTAAFWPKGQEFDLLAVDIAGLNSSVSASLLFVRGDVYSDPNLMQVVQRKYREDPRSKILWSNQKVSFTALNGAGDVETEDITNPILETNAISFDADLSGTIAGIAPSGRLPFYPKISAAEVQIPAVKRLLGTSKEIQIAFDPIYLQEGFDPIKNRGQIFAKLLRPVGIDFADQTNKAGASAAALVKPDINVVALSRVIGPVGGNGRPEATANEQPSVRSSVETFQRGEFDPNKFFGDAKLLGIIKLKDVLSVVLDAVAESAKVPKVSTREIQERGLPAAIEARYDWTTPIKGDPTGILTADAGASLALESVLHTPLVGGGEPSYNSLCIIKNFSLNLLPSLRVVSVSFRSLTFESRSGQKPRVQVDISSVRFDDKLSFFQELASRIGTGGRGPHIDVTTSGIQASYSFAIPSVTLGSFSLQNISISIGFVLSFNGEPISLRFAFGERYNPFLVTVGMFGGGGYFGMVIRPSNSGELKDSVTFLEAALEFGGNWALDVPPIAAGKVYLMAGIRFTIGVSTDLAGELCPPSPSAISVTGYVRCGGLMRVIGMVDVSVTFYMGLTYCIQDNSFVGRAELEVRVKYLFFCKSVKFTVTRRFAGPAHAARLDANGHIQIASSRPSDLGGSALQAITFSNLFTEHDWEKYCDAFA